MDCHQWRQEELVVARVAHSYVVVIIYEPCHTVVALEQQSLFQDKSSVNEGYVA